MVNIPLFSPFLPPLQLFLLSAASALPKDIWHVSVFEGPAPAPEDGPPLSANSIRDPAYLPGQIGAIIGSYLLSVVIISCGLLFVGRRLRRAAQASPRTLDMEMVKPVQMDDPKVFDPSPISPAIKNPYGPSPSSTLDMKNNWPSPDKAKSSTRWPSIKGHSYQPSIQSSVVTFDESVIEDDKAKNQQEMERLYAAVMEHEEHKSTLSVNRTDGSQPQHPPELQHLRSNVPLPQPNHEPPRTDTKSPARTLTASPKKSVRPSPIMTHSRNSSRSSFGSFGKKRGVRNLPISPPMGSPDSAPNGSGQYGETEPLSPRLYNPGPPPPTPPYRDNPNPEEEFSSRNLSGSRQPSLREGVRTPRTSIPRIQTVPEAPDSGEPVPDAINPSSHQRKDSASGKAKRAPAPLALRTENSFGSSGPLPLRSAPLPFRNLNNSRAAGDRPPSMIKATVLERKAPQLGTGGSPRTGGIPATPYSPYMPYTPLTPMTPSRLVTREERKRREKEEGRRVATVEDAVEEEGEMWGDAYA
ncbi:MAG: hypothetical protein Q9214_001219 [Letrouitia sp. 1 TL-2023]